MSRRIFRSGDYSTADEVSRGTFLDCSVEESRTRQSFAADADINQLVKRFGVTGLAQRHPVQPATVQLFEDVFDFQSAMNAVVDAERRFAMLDAKVRRRFGNDPQEFVEFCSDPANADEMIKLGLATRREVVDNAPKPDVPAGDGDVRPEVDVGKGAKVGKVPKGRAGADASSE